MGRIEGRGFSLDRVRIGEDGGTCNLLVVFRPRGAGSKGCDPWSSYLELKRGLWDQMLRAWGWCGLGGQWLQLQNGGDALRFTDCSRGCQYPTHVPLVLTIPAPAGMPAYISLPEDILWLQEHAQPPHRAIWKLGELRFQE